MRAALCALAVMLAVGGAATVRAADADPKLAEGKRLFDTGRLHYDVGDFAEALVEFRRAYELTNEPSLLHDVGLCQQQLGRNADAATSYQQFLERSSQVSDRDRRDVESVIRELDGGRQRIIAAPPRPQDKTPLYRRWWLWTAVGGGVLVLSLGLGLGLGGRDHYDGTRGAVTFP
jgi:tetratricopeptide (TPR) repeat protein